LRAFIAPDEIEDSSDVKISRYHFLVGAVLLGAALDRDAPSFLWLP
jgi:hypothetical protein